jgi:hypothetical protein
MVFMDGVAFFPRGKSALRGEGLAGRMEGCGVGMGDGSIPEESAIPEGAEPREVLQIERGGVPRGALSHEVGFHDVG